MKNVQRYYLIDFENVNDEGLIGSDSLNDQDQVHLFYTDNAKKMNLDNLNLDCKFIPHKVPVGKQSLDMFLVSYLGYLVGQIPKNTCEYIIVSKDTDYDNIIEFWRKQKSISVIRQNRINIQNRQSTSFAPQSQYNANQRCELNTKVQQELRRAGYDKEKINHVASIVVKYCNTERAANNIHNALRSEYKEYTEIYKIIKPIISRENKGNNDNSKLNNEIQKILSNAGFNNFVVSEVASLVCKHHREPKAKQTIYRIIISQYGSGQGLNIYNHIKKHI